MPQSPLGTMVAGMKLSSLAWSMQTTIGFGFYTDDADYVSYIYIHIGYSMISYVDLRRYVMVFHTQTISQVHGCQQMNACSGGARPGGCNQVVLESKGLDHHWLHRLLLAWWKSEPCSCKTGLIEGPSLIVIKMHFLLHIDYKIKAVLHRSSDFNHIMNIASTHVNCKDILFISKHLLWGARQ